MLKFEEYLSDFTNTINLLDFIINLIVASLLAMALKVFYTKYGTSIANREKFANNFVPLALATMLVITVVQASIALSLGLVGALSIVRFRAAIKEPEELTYLFLVIGIGLVTGANKPILAVIAISLILILLFLNVKFRSNKLKGKDAIFINLRTSISDLIQITDLFKKHLSFAELKRMDTIDSGGNFVSFLAKADDIQQLAKLRESILAIDPKAQLSIIDQPDLVL